VSIILHDKEGTNRKYSDWFIEASSGTSSETFLVSPSIFSDPSLEELFGIGGILITFLHASEFTPPCPQKAPLFFSGSFFISFFFLEFALTAGRLPN